MQTFSIHSFLRSNVAILNYLNLNSRMETFSLPTVLRQLSSATAALGISHHLRYLLYSATTGREASVQTVVHLSSAPRGYPFFMKTLNCSSCYSKKMNYGANLMKPKWKEGETLNFYNNWRWFWFDQKSGLFVWMKESLSEWSLRKYR